MTNAGVNGYPTAAAVTATNYAGRLVSGNYYCPTGLGSTGTSATNGTFLRCLPWIVPNACTISRIGAEVTSAGDSGSKVRLGIYADNGNGYPGALVIDAGTIAGDSATYQEITISQALPAGLYWVASSVQVYSVTQPTVRIAVTSAPTLLNLSIGTGTPASNVTTMGFAQAAVTGAFPAVFAAGNGTCGASPRIFVKVA